jgi:hypothetical protein
MRTARWLAGGTLAAGLALATLAVAQPRGRGHAAPPRPKPSATSGSDNPYDDKGEKGEKGGAAPAAAGAGASDAGVVPAPPPMTTPDGGKLSPLNPAPEEFSDAGMPAMAIDYDRLLADVASLRARVAAVSDTLFHSRIVVSLQTRGDHARTAGLTVSLDDGIVWTAPASFRADDATVVYDHAVAPGHHALTVDVDRRDDRNDTFRSSQRSRFVVEVPADQRHAVEIDLSDDSDMADDFPSDKKGQYDLRVRMKAKAQPMPR